MSGPEMNKEVLDQFRQLAREVTLCLGGVFAVHEVPDEVVWRTAKSLDQIFERFTDRVSTADDPSKSPSQRKFRPHPAIEELLRNIKNYGRAA